MISLIISLSLAAPAPDYFRPLSQKELNQATQWIDGWKKSPKGPYSGVLWTCNDGAVLEPKLNACVEHGGGRMFGILTPQAARLGNDYGLYMGTIFASLTAEPFFASNYYRCRAYIIESYLERALDGWVLKQAKTYRGFRQVEDESEFARQAIMEVTKNKDVLTTHRGMIVRLIRTLPYGKRSSLADEIRALAALIGDADVAGFGTLRFKIHAMPEPADIEPVRRYAETHPGERGDKARELADKMQTYYTPAHRLERLKEIRQWIYDPATKKAIDALLAADMQNATQLVEVGANLIATAEKAIFPGTTSKQGERNLLLLHAMAIVEEMWVAVTADMVKGKHSRAQGLELLGHFVRAGFSLGWFGSRERDTLLVAISDIKTGEPARYAQAVKTLSRSLEWARARLLSDVGVALQRYQQVEPRAVGVIDDQLRSSMMLPYAALLDRLNADVERLRGGGHRIVGIAGVGTASLRGDNPGLATGTLHLQLEGESPHDLSRNDIALLSDLPPELPPVAGIITVGAAGSLSHVALLARNLGIPLASIGGDVATALKGLAGQPFVLGVSGGGRVVLGPLAAFATAERKQLVEEPKAEAPVLEIDAQRLDLASAALQPLTAISEADTGVRVGPKAGELGRLKRLFGDRVSDAAVIPFGAFVRHVNRPGKDGTPSPLEQLVASYRNTTTLSAEAAEATMLPALATFRTAIATLPFPDGFEREVEQALKNLGGTTMVGVFVRSDTNVEDLKDFTGAGLNLTVPNRVGVRSVLQSIREVWASPYSERSYRWRQRLLKNPEHVYPSVILHRTVPSEISGVMVTTNVEGGGTPGLTVSASEGVSAVVDGGAPETLVLTPEGGITLLASARSSTRKSIPRPPEEGIKVEYANGREPLLGDKELQELRTLAREVGEKIPARTGNMPWDIEFGFVRGKAYLMQIRPLRLSRAALTQPFLQGMDAKAALPTTSLDLSQELP